MNTTGDVLKFLRESKNLSRRSLAKNIIDHSYLAKVENNQTAISIENLDLLLKKMYVSLGEFEYLRNGYSLDEISQIGNDIYNSFYKQNNQRIEDIKINCIEKYKDTQNMRYKHYSILCEYILNDFDIDFNASEIQEINTYLISCDNYTYYDIILLANFYRCFQNEVLFSIFDKMLKDLNKYQDFARRNQLILPLLNLLDIAIKTRDKKRVITYYEELEKQTSDPLDLLVKLNKHYFRGIVMIFNNKIYEGKKIVNKALREFYFFELDVAANAYKKEVNQLIKDIKKNPSITQ